MLLFINDAIFFLFLEDNFSFLEIFLNIFFTQSTLVIEMISNSNSNLNSNSSNKRKQTVPKSKPTSSVKICDRCSDGSGFSTSEIAEFIEHMKAEHNLDEIYPCDLCYFYTESLWDYQGHMEQHLSEKSNADKTANVATSASGGGFSSSASSSSGGESTSSEESEAKSPIIVVSQTKQITTPKLKSKPNSDEPDLRLEEEQLV